MLGAFVPNDERNGGMKEKTVFRSATGVSSSSTGKLHGLVPESFEIVHKSSILAIFGLVHY